MKKKAYRNLLIIISFIILITIIITKFGRNVPYKNDIKEDNSNDNNKNNIELIYNVSEKSHNISLDGLEQSNNLIPGSYANRTLFILKYNNKNQNKDNLKTSNIYKDGELLNSDNFIFLHQKNIFEIIIIDHEFTKDEILKFTVGNEDLFGLNKDKKLIQENIKDTSNIITKEGVASDNLIFQISDEEKYFRLPNVSQDEILLLPLQQNQTKLTDIDIKTKSINNSKLLDGYNYVELSLDNMEPNYNKIKPFKLKGNIVNSNIPVDKTYILINNSIILPFNMDILSIK